MRALGAPPYDRVMCDTIVVVRPDGVRFAKNSDRDPNEAQCLEWHPAATHEDGATVRCTWIDVPQAPRTNGVLISRPFWMWGAEMGANEHGLVIGNEAVFTREKYAKRGLTGMDLLRLALERAASAREAVDVITGLLERHGQGGGCGHENRSFRYHNSFLVADSGEAWVLETAGRKWASEQVTSGVRSISNGLTIPAFAREHADRVRTAVSACRARRAITGATAPDADVADLMAVLRSHGPSAWPRYSAVNGAMSAPCMHGGGLVASSQTTASWVADLSGTSPLHWVTATAAPCTSLFKPVRLEEPVDLGPTPTDRADDSTLWWRHERLHRTTVRDPEAAYPRFAPERDAVERDWLADPPAGTEAFARGEELLDGWTAAVRDVVGRDVRPRVVRRYWRLRERRAGLAI